MPSEPLRSVSSPCSLIPCCLAKLLLLQLELRGQVEQSHLFLFFGDHFVEEGEMVAEKADARGIVHRNILADILLVKDGGHRRDILMAEAQIDAGEAGIAGLDRCNADCALRSNHVAGQDLLREGHRLCGSPCGADTLVRRCDRRQEHPFLHARHVKRKQSPILDHLPRDLVFLRGELTEREFFSGANSIDQ